MDNRKKPDWAVVLDVLYEGEYSKVEHEDDVHSDDLITYSDLADQTPLTEIEVKNAMQYMEKAGLIHNVRAGDRVGEVTIKPKGFEVAHDRRLLEYREERESNRIEQQEHNEDRRAERQNEVNKLIGFFTFGLLAVTFFDTATSIAPTEMSAKILLLEGLVIIGIGIAAIKSGVFGSDES